MADSGAKWLTLPAEALAWRCPADWLQFRTTDELETCEESLGQSAAIAALKLGLGIRGPGYNVFVAGSPGTGRRNALRQLLDHERKHGPVPPDLVYVPNFDNFRAPRLLRLPAGKGRVLRDAMAAARERTSQAIQALRSSSIHRARRDTLVQGFRDERARLIADFEAELAVQGMSLVEATLGPFRRHDLAVTIGEDAVPIEDLPGLVREGKLTQIEADELRARHPELAARLSDTAARLRGLRRDVDQALAEADRASAGPLINDIIEDLRGALDIAAGASPALDEYLRALAEYLLNVVPLMFAAGERLVSEGLDEASQPDPLDALRLHILVDRTGETGRPIVEEPYPSPRRLMGFVEPQRGPEGMPRADLSGIRPGALHQADGGFLVLQAHDVLAEEGAWSGLRRVLRTGQVDVWWGDSGEGPPPLSPQPAPVDVTVILVGTPAVREGLIHGDEEFGRLFKITALFDDRVPLTRDYVHSYACFLAMVLRDEGLPPFDADAVARLCEQMVRMADGRQKLSTQFRKLADFAREAVWFAREEGAQLVRESHVARGFRARRDRDGLLSNKIRESIREGILRLEFSGRRIGQVNALAVVETSLERFGYPVRVTATTAVGGAGIIDIEREAELSGEIYTKASLILAGFLRSRFAQHYPLAMTASICFEQSYGGVEGDSASAAELVALLSSLAGVPIRQDLAVTGAVDQLGQVLAVGGINEKIEGFFTACGDRGLPGEYGVLIPATSAASLQLGGEVLDAVRAGTFHVYAVDDVEALVELMLGVPMGVADPAGRWPEGSVSALIAQRLREMAETRRDFGSDAP